MSDDAVSESLRQAAEHLLRDAGKAPPSLFDPRTFHGRMLRKAILDDSLRSALFQMVDVLPTLDEPARFDSRIGTEHSTIL